MFRSRTPEYRAWDSLFRRCYDPRDKEYPRYGGRGITVCERWFTFANFLLDMGYLPSPALTIERDDNNGPYELGNCRWATRKEQARNRRSSALVTYQGRTQCIAAWAEEIGMNQTTLRARLKISGWPVERAFTQAVQPSLSAVRL